MTAAAEPTAKAPRRKRTAKPVPPLDRVTDYAQRVLAGEIIAGPHVRHSCARHLRDLKEGPARGLTWSLAHAIDAIAFFEEVLFLNGGEYEGKPFILQPWQAFIVGNLYGWLRDDERAPGDASRRVRRFRVAYVETGKGSGKSPLAAGVGMKGLCADNEPRAEIYAAATKKDQAMILFRDAVAMYEQSPELRKRLWPSGKGEKTWNLAYGVTGSWFRPISADDGQSGPRPHIGLIDEYHEHKTNNVLEMMRAGFKSRRQPLIFVITNSGAGDTTPCGQYHDTAIKIAQGVVEDDTFFSYVCGVDEGEDPFEDESCWPKANPSLQLANLPGWTYLRDQVREARNMPSKEALVRRLNFCQWTSAISPWLSAAVWAPCRQEFDLEQLRGRRVYGGLDLSSTTDLTAFVLLVEPIEKGEPWKMLAWCWLPEDGLDERMKRDRVDYRTWATRGYLELTPGRAISKRHVLLRVMQILEAFECVSVAYDRWRIADLVKIAEDEGIELPPMVEFGQGFKDMSPAIDAFETAILNRTVAHDGHPVLTWCVANAVTDSDPAGNRKLNKAKATGRIDLVVASVMAHGCIAQAEEESDTMEQAFVDL